MKIRFVVKAMVSDSTQVLNIDWPEGVSEEEFNAANDAQLEDHIGQSVDAYWEIVEDGEEE